MMGIEIMDGNKITQGVGTNRLKREEKNNVQDIALGQAVVWDFLAKLYGA